jgi:hypothetical protein
MLLLLYIFKNLRKFLIRFLNVGDHFLDIFYVSTVNQRTGPKTAFPLLVLAGQDVAVKSSSPLQFAGPGLAETLGCSPVCFDLGHFILR